MITPVKMIVLALLVCFSACKHGGDDAGLESDLAAAPDASDSISSEDAEKIALEIYHLFIAPSDEREKLQHDLYWCAINSLWAAFPMGKAINVDSLKTSIMASASGRYSRPGDIFNVLNAVRKIATASEMSIHDKITGAFSLMQIINAKLGGGALGSGALNVAKTLSDCSVAIIAGSDQLIKAINDLNDNYSPREIMQASNIALGKYVGPVVGSFIVAGGQVTKAGDALGTAVGEQLYPNRSVQPLISPDGKRSCCYQCRQEFRSNTVFGRRAAGNSACGTVLCRRTVGGESDCVDRDSDWTSIAGPDCAAAGAKNGNTFYRYTESRYGGMVPAEQCQGTDPF